MNAFNSITATERIATPDILRGLSLLGILIANMGIFSGNVSFDGLTELQSTVLMISSVLTDFSFNTIFSFLFGFGFILFFNRAKFKNGNPNIMYIRRLLMLLFIGILHAFIGWYGDVLMFYSFMGVLLYLFRNFKPKTLVKIACSVFLVPVILLLSAMFLGPSEFSSDSAATSMDTLSKMNEVYSNGGIKDIFIMNARNVIPTFLGYCWIGLTLFPMFLLGAAAGKAQFFLKAHLYKGKILKVLLIAVAGGLLLLVPMVLSEKLGFGSTDGFLVETSMMVSGFCISIVYMSLVVLLSSNKAAMRFLNPLKAVGYISLTNYLMQTFICNLIFNGYGLGLYQKISPTLCILLSVVIFSTQAIASNWWGNRFHYGPFEWVWRSFTYLNIPPFKKGNASKN